MDNDLDMLKMLPKFYFDEITPFVIYLGCIFWKPLFCLVNDNSYVFDNLITLENACNPFFLLWINILDGLGILIGLFSRLKIIHLIFYVD